MPLLLAPLGVRCGFLPAQALPCEHACCWCWARQHMLCAAVFAYTGMRTHRGEGRRLDLHLILYQNLGSAGMRTHRGEGRRLDLHLILNQNLGSAGMRTYHGEVGGSTYT